MLFNGLGHFTASELIESMQRLGISFGSHVSAETGFAETHYALDLPPNKGDKNDRSVLDFTFQVLRDFCDGALFQPEEIDKERGIILSELTTRDTIDDRIVQRILQVLVPDHRIAHRRVIGSREGIQGLARQDFVSFYETYYVPSRFTLIVAGEVPDVDEMQNQIAATFGDMSKGNSLKDDPDVGSMPDGRGFYTSIINEPDAEFDAVYLYAVRSFDQTSEAAADTEQNRIRSISVRLANEMINRRLKALSAQAENPSIVWGGADRSVWGQTIEFGWIQVVLTEPASSDGVDHDSRLERAVESLEQEFRRVLTFGFTEGEVAPVMATILQEYQAKVREAATEGPSNLAQQMLDSLSNNAVFSSPQEDLRIAMLAQDVLLQNRVHQDFVDYWNTQDLTMIYVTRDSTGIDSTVLQTMYEQSQATQVTPFEATDGDFANTSNVNVDETFAYKPSCFGPSGGTIVSDVTHQDLEIRQLVLSNNIRVNLKTTDFRDDSILLSARFGTGTLSQPMNATGLEKFTERVINQGGLGRHSQTELDRLFAGMNIDLNLSVKAGSFIFEGETTPQDLEWELRLLAAYFSDPGYRQDAVQKFRNGVPAFMADLQHTLEGPYHQVRAALKGGDPRFLPPTKEGLMGFTVDDAKEWIQTQLDSSYLEVSLVGDLPTTTVDLLLETIGALPNRASEKALLALDHFSLKFPDTPKTLTYTYESTQLDEGAAIVAWEVPAVTVETTEELAKLQVLQEVFQDRLRVEIREELGKAYGYSAHLRPSEAFDHGEFTALSLVDGDDVTIVGQKMVDIGRVLAEEGILQDEFDRAMEPFLVIENERQHSNHYWLDVIGDSQAKPFYLDAARKREQLFADLSVQDINELASKYLLPEKSVRFETFPVENNPGIRSLRGVQG